jgi:hypothetical protein
MGLRASVIEDKEWQYLEFVVESQNARMFKFDNRKR